MWHWMATNKSWWLVSEIESTNRALVGLLPGVNSHVDEQLVARVEGLLPARAPRPVAGEVLAFALVHVELLDVLHQFFPLAVEGAVAVHPAAAVAPAAVLHLPVLILHYGAWGLGKAAGA